MSRKKVRAADTSFYVMPEYITDSALILEGDNFHHAINVLRQEVGSRLSVVDGAGLELIVKIEEIESRRALCAIVEKHPGAGETKHDVTLAIGMLKAKDRFEYLVEKATELGVTSIVQLKTSRSEGREARPDRVRRIAIAAMKQSRRSVLPHIGQPVSLEEFVPDDNSECRIFGTMDSLATPVLSALEKIPSNASITVVVGPEGGLDEAEETMLVDHGYQPVSLGSRRLRAETAATSLLVAVQLATG